MFTICGLSCDWFLYFQSSLQLSYVTCLSKAKRLKQSKCSQATETLRNYTCSRKILLESVMIKHTQTCTPRSLNMTDNSWNPELKHFLTGLNLFGNRPDDLQGIRTSLSEYEASEWNKLRRFHLAMQLQVHSVMLTISILFPLKANKEHIQPMS